ncbi:MAG: DUF4198 domain-containing protein [Rhodobacter sp.]|nr:DUF4198 domain-containing protein [Rhodobacter sp.]
MRFLSACLIAALAVSGPPALAHEFWISPQTYSVEPEAQIIAHIRVGQKFEGSAYSFIPQKFARFDLVSGESVIPVEGRIGDRPALAMAAPGDGLVTVVHQTTDIFLSYRDAEKFVNFCNEKDFTWVLDEHKARGLPETGFRERYSRYAKSLVAVGTGAGADREVGMETEIVALANPYTDDLDGGLPVRVLYRGQPRADVQVEIFAKAPDGTVEATKTRTDDAGLAAIPADPGIEYLVDAVVMRALEPVAENDPVWESLWASLTYQVPAAR